MRIVRIANASTAKRVAAAAQKADPGSLERLNPHLDTRRLAPGAVVVLPDIAAADADSIAADAMAAFTEFARQALDAGAARMKSASAEASREEASLAAAAKSPAVGAAIKKDPELGKLLEGALGQAKADTKRSSAAVSEFSTLAKSALAELEALTKRLA